MKTQRRALVPMALRLPAAFMPKLQWLAADKGVTVAQLVRTLIGDAIKEVRLPKAPASTEILGTPDQRAGWQKTAAKFNLTVEQFAAKLLDKAAVKFAG